MDIRQHVHHAGDCYVPDDSTLTLEAGVVVSFDYDYDGDYPSMSPYPQIEVRGTLVCNGSGGNEVRFTNYSGTNRGEFKGLVLNGTGSLGYEGLLEADYAIFEYGGYDGALIAMGSDAFATLNNSWVRFSDNAGIGSSAAFDSLYMEMCYVDSNDTDGISIENACTAISLTDVTAFGNGFRFDAGWPRLIFRGEYIRNVDGNGIDIILGDLPEEIMVEFPFVIERSEIYNCTGNGIYISIDINSDNQKISGNIRNCAVARNIGSGIYVDQYSPPEQDNPLRILNSVLWDNDQSGIYVNALDNNLQDQGNLIIQNCILGLNDMYGIEIPEVNLNMEQFYIGDDTCAFKDNAEGSYNDGVLYLADYIEDSLGVPDHFELAVEEYDQDSNPPYDFHIKWDSPAPNDRTLINEGDDDQGCGLDIDGSPTDIGLYGGQVVADFIRHEIYSEGRDVDFYVRVNAITGEEFVLEETRPINLWRNVYRVFEGMWLTGPDDDHIFEIEAGTRIEFSEFSSLSVGNTLSVLGEANNRVTMTSFGEDEEWNGVIMWGWLYGATHDCELNYLDIDNVVNGEGIWIVELEEGQLQDQVPIRYVRVHDCATGIRIDDSRAVFRGCELTDNTGWGLVVLGGNDEIQIEGGVYSENDLNGILFAGANTSAIIKPNNTDFDSNDGEYYTHTENNGEYGIGSYFSSTPDLAGDTQHIEGKAKIHKNGIAQIYVDHYNSRPTLHNGNNDIFPPNANTLAIIYDNSLNQGVEEFLDAVHNYWGTAEPDEHEEDLFDGPINYDPWDNSRNTVDGADDLGIALAYHRNNDPDTIAMAIPLFKEVAEGDDYSGHARFASLSYLRGSYKRGHVDDSDLRTYFLDYAENVGDHNLTRTARSQAIWWLSDHGYGEEAIEEAAMRRCQQGVNRQDSLIFAIDELGLRQLHENREFDVDALDNFEKRLEELDKLVADAGSEASNGVCPSLFNLLYEPYPNPFNSSVKISFDVVGSGVSPVRLGVYDNLGRLVKELVNQRFEAGNHSLIWDADRLPSGSYHIRANIGDRTYVRRMSLVK